MAFGRILETVNNAPEIHRENAAKEALQRSILEFLAQRGALRNTAFQGGTALRLLHGLRRYSEDLDFIYTGSAPGIRAAPKDWGTLILELIKSLGLIADLGSKIVEGQTQTPGGKNIFQITAYAKGRKLKELVDGDLKISLEVDLNPPKGFVCDSPEIELSPGVRTKVPTLALPSLMAGKMHILLSRRDREKGRDWYDYNWYRDRKVEPNLEQLGNAITQTSPEKIRVDCWGSYIRSRLKEMRWPELRRDVGTFLENADELTSLSEHALSEKTPAAPFELLNREVHDYAQRSESHPLHWDPSLEAVRIEIQSAAESGDMAAFELTENIRRTRTLPIGRK